MNFHHLSNDEKITPAFGFSIECFCHRFLTHYKKNHLKNAEVIFSSSLNIKFFGILLLLIFFPLLINGQSNCLEGCNYTYILDGEKKSFNYQLIVSDDSDISFLDGKYLINSNGKSSIKTKLVFDEFPENLTLLFSKKWNSNKKRINVKYSCRKIKKSDAIKEVTIFFEDFNELSNGVIHFAISKDNLSCNDIASNNSLPFTFTFSEEIFKKYLFQEDKKAVVDTIENNEITTTASTDSSLEETIKTEQLLDTPVIALKEKIVDTIGKETVVVDRPVPDTSTNENDTFASINPPTTPPPPVVEIEAEKPLVVVPKKTAEDKLWSKTKRENSLEAFSAFKSKYPNSRKYGKLVERAITKKRKEIAQQSEIDIEYPFKEIENGYAINLKNVFNLQVDTILHSEATYSIKKQASKNEFISTLFITNIEKNKNIEVKLSDSEKPDSVRFISIPLGNNLEVLPISYNEDSSKIQKIEFKEGQKPYTIYFIKDGITLKRQQVNTNFWTPEPEYFEQHNLIGDIQFKISDSRQSVPYTNKDWSVNIPEKPDLKPYWLGGLALLLTMLVFIYPQMKEARKKRNRNQYKAKRSDQLQTHIEKVNLHKEKFTSDIQEIIEEGGNEFVVKKSVQNMNKAKLGIQVIGIKRAASKAKKYLNEKLLYKIINQEIVFEFDARVLWEDTMISSVYFTQKSIRNLDAFLQAENLNPIQEKDDQIPEIGGILLGRPFLIKKQNTYKVLVDEFVPIDPEYNDRYQLQFSAQSMARDLGNIQEKFPDLMLVGWFHTHPGHGLFLSRPDLRIHDSFFKESYQFAMEIDSMSPRLDTGFFTRMKNGKVNNRKNLITDTQWYSWLDADLK